MIKQSKTEYIIKPKTEGENSHRIFGTFKENSDASNQAREQFNKALQKLETPFAKFEEFRKEISAIQPI